MSFIKKTLFDLKTKFFNLKLKNAFLENKGIQYSSNLELLNFNKRKALINHAYKHTKFYNKLYNSVNIELDNESDFSKLPIVKREHLKNEFSDFIADNVSPKDYYKATTGGSSGMPVSVLHDKRYPLTGIQWRVLKWWGVQPHENSAYVYRLRRTGLKKILNTLMWWPTRRIFLDAANINNESIMKFVKEYDSIKPTLLQGYTGGIYELALFLRDNNIKLSPPKAVWVTSAPLSNPQRRIMEEVFLAPVYDQYGTCEVMWLAAECKEQKGLHMMSDIRHIEFVDENNQPVPDGEWGRILLTDLHNYAFPLIRYEIGDVGRALPNKCKCGVQLPLMDNVKGRKSDVIKTPQGIKISGEYLTTLFDDYPDAVREFQVVQAVDYSLTIKYIPFNTEGLDKIIHTITKNLEEQTKNQIPIIAQQVNEIKHFKGKTQFVINELNTK